MRKAPRRRHLAAIGVVALVGVLTWAALHSIGTDGEHGGPQGAASNTPAPRSSHDGHPPLVCGKLGGCILAWKADAPCPDGMVKNWVAIDAYRGTSLPRSPEEMLPRCSPGHGGGRCVSSCRRECRTDQHEEFRCDLIGAPDRCRDRGCPPVDPDVEVDCVPICVDDADCGPGYSQVFTEDDTPVCVDWWGCEQRTSPWIECPAAERCKLTCRKEN